MFAIPVLASLSPGYGDVPFGIDGLLSGIFGPYATLMVHTASALVFVAVCSILQ